MVKIARTHVEQRLSLLRAGVQLSCIAEMDGVSPPAVCVSLQRAGADEYRRALIDGLKVRLKRLEPFPPAWKRLASHAHDRYPDVFPSVRRPSKAERRAEREVNAMDIREIAGK